MRSPKGTPTQKAVPQIVQDRVADIDCEGLGDGRRAHARHNMRSAVSTRISVTRSTEIPRP